jgi:hypothetical protein
MQGYFLSDSDGAGRGPATNLSQTPLGMWMQGGIRLPNEDNGGSSMVRRLNFDRRNLPQQIDVNQSAP